MTSEPTTGEIVRALRFKASFGCSERGDNCGGCPCDKLRDENGEGSCDWGTDKAAADRLESQECEIEELKADAFVNALENAERIANLTARAEQAELERDELKEKVIDYELAERGF